MDINQRTAFVTGGTGKIGRHLVARLLAYGFQVRALVRSEDYPWIASNSMQVVKGDILDSALIKGALQGCDYLFHLAVYQNMTDEDKDLFTRVNITGTETVLNCAINSGVQKIIYVSTAMVFGPTGKLARGENWQKKESDETDYYLGTKLEALKIINAMKGFLPIIVVYPTAVIDLNDFASSSPADSEGIQKFLWEKVGRGIPGGLGNLIGPKNRIMNYVIMEDAVEGIIQAALYGKPGEDYILGGENISVQDYLKATAKRVNKKPFPVHFPFFLFRAMAFAGRFIRIPHVITVIAKHCPVDRCLSSDKARQQLGYDPKGRL